MRILLLIQAPQARGAEIFASHLGEQLLKNGHQVLLFSLFPGDLDLPFSGKQIHFNRSAKARFWDFGAWKKLSDEIRVFQPDVVQAMGGDTLKWMVISKIIFGWKAKTVFYNGSLVSRYFKSALIQRFNQLLYRSLDGIVAVSEASKSDFEKIASFYGIHRVIPVGLKPPALEKMDLSHSVQTLVHIGGFTFEKNHEGLFRIFKQILNEKPNAKLVLIGDGPLKKQAEKSVSQMGISDSVSFLGAKSQPFEFVPADSLLLLPSLIEGLPAVILEAFYSGIPVLAYEVGGVGEVLKKGETGFPIPAGDENFFAKQALAIMKISQIELQPILNNAKNLVAAEFSMSSVSKKYEDFYFELCGLSK